MNGRRRWFLHGSDVNMIYTARIHSEIFKLLPKMCGQNVHSFMYNIQSLLIILCRSQTRLMWSEPHVLLGSLHPPIAASTGVSSTCKTLKDIGELAAGVCSTRKTLKYIGELAAGVCRTRKTRKYIGELAAGKK